MLQMSCHTHLTTSEVKIISFLSRWMQAKRRQTAVVKNMQDLLLMPVIPLLKDHEDGL